MSAKAKPVKTKLTIDDFTQQAEQLMLIMEVAASAVKAHMKNHPEDVQFAILKDSMEDSIFEKQIRKLNDSIEDAGNRGLLASKESGADTASSLEKFRDDMAQSGNKLTQAMAASTSYAQRQRLDKLVTQCAKGVAACDAFSELVAQAYEAKLDTMDGIVAEGVTSKATTANDVARIFLDRVKAQQTLLMGGKTK